MAAKARNWTQTGWELLVVVTATVAAYFVPLTQFPGFVSPPTEGLIEVFLTLIFGLDLVARWRTFRSNLTRRPIRAIAGFAVDVVAAIPFFFLFGPTPLQLLRALKLVRVVATMRRVGRIYVEHAAGLRLFFFVYWLALGIHLIACGWIQIDADSADMARIPHYVEALYWSVVTITTVGYGDIVPVTLGQKIYATFVMMMGVGVYAYLIGNIASLISNLDPVRARYLSQRERLGAFMQYRSLPTPLRRRIQRYFDYLWENRLVYNESEVLTSLPPMLREEVALHLKRDLIKNVPLFQNAEEAFVRDVALQLEGFVALPGDFIVRAGEPGREMFFLSRGKVEVIGRSGGIVNTLEDGDFFGEIALFMDEPRTASVRAKTPCDLYVLDKSLFERIVSDYPDVAGKMEDQARVRRSSEDIEPREPA
ncbi:MAG: cyclic nucleotide-binding domain-containing protein [Rubricoccaceae bacterium]|nr:cyclic nucleotide-binding domain-containing protein [Rubricoccaceae bacterium]